MKKYLYIIVLGLMLMACSKPMTDEARMREALVSLSTQYPLMTLQDVYKTCYQDFFGAEHAAPDSLSAARYLAYELSTMPSLDSLGMPAYEPCGWRHRYVRLSLEKICTQEITEAELLHRFLEAARNNQPPTDDWLAEWLQIEQVALVVNPAWANDTLQADLREAASHNWAIHHSAAFREAYHPHYRIVRAD